MKQRFCLLIAFVILVGWAYACGVELPSTPDAGANEAPAKSEVPSQSEPPRSNTEPTKANEPIKADEPLVPDTTAQEDPAPDSASGEVPVTANDAGPQDQGSVEPGDAGPQVEPIPEQVQAADKGTVPEATKEAPPVPDTPRKKPTKPVIIGVGNFGLRLRTFDGIKWEQQGGNGSGNNHTVDLLRKVAYGDGVFVAVGGKNNHNILRTEDGGKTWQDVGWSTGGWLGGVTYHPPTGDWFIKTGGGTTVLRSTDRGKTWKKVDTSGVTRKPKGGIHGGIESHGGVLMVLGDEPFFMYSKDNGKSWLYSPTTLVTNRLKNPGYIAKRWFVGGDDGCIYTSDFKKWTKCASPALKGGQFLTTPSALYHFNGTGYHVTTDGKTWKSFNIMKHMGLPVLPLGSKWLTLYWGGVRVGPALDKLQQVHNTRRNANSWTYGYTY